jgi:hypothetical protein
MKALTRETLKLKSAFAGRKKPGNWIRDDLRPVDLLDAADFVRDMKAGKDRAVLFQSAIPYFALLTDEARIFLLPDFLATLVAYPHEILTKVCDFEDERGKVLLRALNPEELNAVNQFLLALSEWGGMRPFLAEIKKMAALVDTCRTRR